ncbi:MAG: shikimate dehydrogenase [Ramlibacter sp.]|jgi:shikimate dehydrogenase
MDRYGLMGNPVSHSKSPWIHTRYAQITGQDLTYDAHLVPLDGFVPAVQAFRAAGGRGCNVTAPFKFETMALPRLRLSARAALAGACNTLRFDGQDTFGDNTDGIGLVRDITVNAGVPVAGRRVLMVGAGGASAGVLGPMLEAGPARLTIANRSPDRARDLAARHAALAARHGVALDTCGLDGVGTAYDIVINASASSLAGLAAPVPATVLGPGTLACDLMYGPGAKGFLDWARAHGAQARDGLGMLVEQAAEAFSIWRGVRPPADQVLTELRQLLETPQA